MTADDNRARTLLVLDRAFNQGDTSVFDTHVAPRGSDHQEAPGSDFRAHLGAVVRQLRSAFPDLHFEVHHALSEGEIVAFHSTMTGTHTGVLNLGPLQGVAPTGRRVSVRHMHFLRWEDGQNTDLWHLMDVPGLLRQLGLTTPAPRA